MVLDGRHSSDDLGIEHWRWSRDAESLAAGTIVGNTTSPLLIITDLVPGSYSFNLEVSDAQGLSSNKSVKISVSQDQDMINIIELVLNMNLSHFTQVQVSRLSHKSKISLIQCININVNINVFSKPQEFINLEK